MANKVTKDIKRSYIELHIAVFLWGFTAILGKVISLEEVALVWWRLLFTCVSLLFFKSIWKHIPTYSWSLIFQMMGVGVIVALHWVLFFGSVKYSNVSICLVCMATASLFTSLIEPIIMGYKHKTYEVLLGLLVIPGMFLVVNFIPSDKIFGVYLGLISALLAAIFSILNKKIIDKEKDLNPIPMTFIELSSGLLFLSIIFPLSVQWLGETPFMPVGWTDIVYLLILALLCTTLGYVLGLKALKHLSAFASNLVVNLEPVYGIILAFLLFQENKEVGSYFYLGVIIILIAVFLHPLLSRKFEKGN
jgi:drug/metabolite transporter (DMT)-like permease